MGLAARLERLSRYSRSGALSLAWLFALPAGALGSSSAGIVVLILSMLSGFSGLSGEFGALLMMGLPITFFAIGALGGVFLVQQLLLAGFSRHYLKVWQHMETTELPLLVADEVYSLSLLELVKDNLSFQFSGSPLPRSLEDQLLIAAAYINALRICQFSSAESSTPMLKEGGRGYLLTRPHNRTVRAIGSATFCIPYISCLGFFWLPFLIRDCLRMLELQAARAAISDYFGDAPRRALSGPRLSLTRPGEKAV